MVLVEEDTEERIRETLHEKSWWLRVHRPQATGNNFHFAVTEHPASLVIVGEDLTRETVLAEETFELGFGAVVFCRWKRLTAR